MTGFAGSRSLDERRRRRLASGAESVAFEPPVDAAPRRAAPPKIKRSRRGPAHFPLRKVISIRYWKLLAVVLGAALAATGILLGGWAAATHGERLGPGFVLFFRLDSARLVRGFAVFGLLLSGQLALLISWVRSQSLQDFSGRYRGWVLCAVAAFIAAIGLQTQLAAAWSATATWLWPAPLSSISHKATLLWLIPTMLGGAFVHAYLVREMRDCRVSLTFLWLTFLLGGGAAAIVLARPLPFAALDARLIECGVALSFVVCLFASALFHARHVVYVCVDPPAIRPSRVMSLLRWFRPWTLFKFNRAGAKASRKSDRGTVTSLKRRTQKRTRPLRGKPTTSPESPVEETDSPSGQSSAESRRAVPQSTALNSKNAANAAEPKATALQASSAARREEEPRSFAGLNRRERRLLKKQMRTEQPPLRRSA
jgi:hypothetical protein